MLNVNSGISLAKMIQKMSGFVQRWVRRRSIEAELYSLSNAMLEDIGLVRADIALIARESAKSKAPIMAVKVASAKSEIADVADVENARASDIANDNAAEQARMAKLA